jgi:two-component system, NarL family, sensor kinase
MSDQRPFHFIDENTFLELLPIAAYGVKAPDGVIIWFNKRAADLWGREPKVGDTDERFCGAHTLFYPDGSYMAHGDTPAAFALKTGQSIHQAEVIIERPDGSRVTVSVHADAIRDDQGKIVGVVSFLHDITERKNKEAELQNVNKGMKTQSENLHALNTQLAEENADHRNAQEALLKSEERFRRLTETLEQKVRERTLELEQRNAEVVTQAEQLRSLSTSLLQAQDEERRHIARELHDSAGQLLAALTISLDQGIDEARHSAPHLISRLDEVQRLAHQLLREVRTASYLLHPPLLDEAGLSSALSWYVQGVIDRSGIQVELEIDRTFERLPSGIELAIFRLVQECLTNVHRHSSSKTAYICVARERAGVRVEVRDQGKGMSPDRLSQIQSKHSGVGIMSIRERVRELNGEMNIESGAAGTTITATIPIPQEDHSTEDQPFQTAV